MPYSFFKRKKINKKIEWLPADDIKTRIDFLTKNLGLDWLDTENIYCFRSTNSKARAYARIWGLNKVWQLALQSKPKYIIEVLSENYDKLAKREQDKVLLHEITHIPKNFSGSLMPHIRKKGKRNFHDKVEELYARYLRKTND
jgi:predicted metallopeptidase